MNVYEAVQWAPPSEKRRRNVYAENIVDSCLRDESFPGLGSHFPALFQQYPWDDDLKYSFNIKRRTSTNNFDQRFLYRSVQDPTKKASREHDGGSIPSATFRRSAGLWRIDEIYFITIDAYVNCPEHFLTIPSSTSTEGQESSK